MMQKCVYLYDKDKICISKICAFLSNILRFIHLYRFTIILSTYSSWISKYTTNWFIQVASFTRHNFNLGPQYTLQRKSIYTNNCIIRSWRVLSSRTFISTSTRNLWLFLRICHSNKYTSCWTVFLYIYSVHALAIQTKYSTSSGLAFKYYCYALPVKQLGGHTVSSLSFRGCVCVCIRIQTGDINKRGTIVPVGGGVPGLVCVYKTNEDIAEKKLCPNNDRSPIEGVYACASHFWCHYDNSTYSVMNLDR